MHTKIVFRHLFVLIAILLLPIFANEKNILITIAGENSDPNEINNGWFSAIFEGHLKLRFTPLTNVKISAFEEINTNLKNQKISYGQSVGMDVIKKLYTVLNSDFVVNSFYEVEKGGDTISLLMELFSVKLSKDIGQFDKRFPISESGQNLDSAFVVICKGIGANIEEVFPKGIFQDVSTPSIKVMNRYGSTWAAFLTCQNSSAKQDAYGALLSASEESSVFAVGTYLTAIASEKMKDYGNSASLYNRLTLRNGLYYPDFYVKILKNFRLSGNNGQSGRTIIVAEKKGINSAAFIVEKARYLKKIRKNDEAFLAYKEAYKLDPTFGEAVLALADIAYNKNEYKVALDYYKKVIKNNENNRVIQERVVELLSKLNLTQNLEKELKILVKLDPTSKLANRELALLFIKRGEISKALKYSKFDTNDNKFFIQHKKRYLSVANFYFETKKDTAKALFIYSNLISAGFKNDKALIRVAQLKFSKKNYRETISLINSVSPKARKNKKIYRMMAMSLIEQGDFAMALKEILALLNIAPNNPETVRLAALCYERTGKTKFAINQYKKYIKLKNAKDKDSLSFHLVGLYEKMNMITAMVTLLKQNSVKYPKNIKNYLKIIEYYKTRNKKELLIYSKKALLLNNAPDTLNLIVANQYKKFKQYANALKYYKNYSTKNPNDNKISKQIAELMFVQKRYLKSIKNYKKYLALENGERNDYYNLALSYFKIKEYKNSADYFTVAISKDSSDTVSYGYKVICYEKLADTISLTKTLENYLKVKKQNYKIKWQLAGLYFEKKNEEQAAVLYEQMVITKKNDIKVRKKLIDIYIKLKDYSRAKVHIDYAIKLKPSSSNLYAQRAKCYLVTGDISAAKVDLKKAIKLAPKKHKVRFFYAGILMSEKKYLEAFNQYKKAVLYNKQNIDYLVKTANCALLAKQKKNAKLYIEKALAFKPGVFKVMESAGIIYANTKNITKAKGFLEEVVRTKKSSASARFELGKIYYNEKNYKKSELLLTVVVNENLKNSEAFEILGDISKIFNRARKAVSYYEKAFALSPKKSKLYFKLVKAHLFEKQFDEAKALVNNSGNVKKNGWSMFANALVDEAWDDLGGAAMGLSSAGKLLPKNREIIYYKGLVKYKQKVYPTALKYFLKIISYKKNSSELYFMMGDCYFKTKNYTNAIKYLNKSLVLNQNQAEVYFVLASIYKKRKNIKSAEKYYKLTIKYDNKNWKSYYNLAQFEMTRRKYESAITLFLDSYKNSREDRVGLDVFRQVGDIYYLKLKNMKKANKYYKKYLKLGGNDTVVKKRVGKLLL